MSRINPISPEVIVRLRATGIPMPGEDFDVQPDITINVDRAEITKAYDMRNGAEYVFGVTVTNRSYARLTLKEFNCEMDWESNLSWISDPRMYRPRTQVYRLKSGKTFYCADVLNHRVRERGIMEPGERWEGILLAYDLTNRIPHEYLHNVTVPGQISVVDHLGREHTSAIELAVDRTATMRPLVMGRVGLGLYGGREAPSEPGRGEERNPKSSNRKEGRRPGQHQ
jgi:hypothetical protein